MMFNPDPVIGRPHQFHSQFAIASGERNQLAPGKFLRCAAFVDINVGALRTNHGVIGTGKRFQGQTICRRPVKDKKYLDIVSELLLKLPDR